MKTLIYLFILFLSLNGISQNVEKYIVADDLYIFSIKQYFQKNDIKNDSIVIIEENPITTKNINLSNIKICLTNELQSFAKKDKKKGIEFLRIVPIRLKNNQFYITIIHFKLEYKNKIMKYTNMSGNSFYFEYNCDIGQFKLVE